jgi:23S rRNA-/tRNA-specific pseudouridylate synthase
VNPAIKLSSPATREFWEIPVLFEDEHLFALDKPSGLLTAPDLANLDRPDLMKLLHGGIAEKKPWARERNLDYLNNAHSLDAGTSGVILLAKSKDVFITLANLFSSQKVAEKYVALVRRTPGK